MTYGTVISGGNRCWLDRNLGASQVAIASNDAASYGDLFQWGRLDDGHQNRNSEITNTTSNTDVPGHANFITNNTDPRDWRIPQNNNLWQGSTGVNNPCPVGYRLPTQTEWQVEWDSWGGNHNANGAINSPLKLPMAGTRYSIGSVTYEASSGFYWSSTFTDMFTWCLIFDNEDAVMNSYYRAGGLSVRCLKE